MKSSILTIFALLLLFFSNSSCKKDNTVYNCYFYTNMESMNGKLDLFIDGTLKAKLPYINADLTTFPDSLKSYTLFLKLKAGKYELKVKDNYGTLKVISTIEFNSHTTSSSGRMGGNGLFLKDKEMIVQLFY